MLSKSLIQFSVDGQGWVPSLLFCLRPNHGGGKEGNGCLLQQDLCSHSCFQCPRPRSRLLPTPLPGTLGHSQAGLAQSLVGTLLLSPGSWCAQGFVCALQESVSPGLWKFCNQIPLAFNIFSGGSQSLCRILRLGNLLWVLEVS